MRDLLSRLLLELRSVERRLSIACGAAALALALIGYQFGVAHGFDRWIPGALEYENAKVAMGLSAYVYGTDQGYLADRRVYDALRKGGFTVYPQFLEPLGTTFPANEFDADLLNKGLKAASSLGHLDQPTGLFTGLEPVEPQDLGGADFYRMAFTVFGIEIQSFFKFYYLTHIISILMFVAAFWRRLESMILLLAIVACHFLALGFLNAFPVEEAFTVATPYSQRFVAALGVVSGLHVALMVWRPSLRTIVNLIALTVQVAILAFVVSVRSSAMWEVLWPATIIAAFAVILLAYQWKFIRWRWRVTPSGILNRSLSWPVVTFAIVFGAMNLVGDARTNPLYRFSDEFITHHMGWHSAFTTLGVHPDWGLFSKDYLDENGKVPGTDALPIIAAENWLKTGYGLNKQYLLSPVRGWRYRTTERVIREVYLDFLKRHPRFTIELHLIYKPKWWYQNFIEWNRMAFKGMPAWGLAVLGATLALLVASAALVRRSRRPRLNSVALAAILGAIWAFVPGIVIIATTQVMSDQSIMVDAALLMCVSLTVGGGASRLRAYKVKKG